MNHCKAQILTANIFVQRHRLGEFYNKYSRPHVTVEQGVVKEGGHSGASLAKIGLYNRTSLTLECYIFLTLGAGYKSMPSRSAVCRMNFLT